VWKESETGLLLIGKEQTVKNIIKSTLLASVLIAIVAGPVFAGEAAAAPARRDKDKARPKVEVAFVLDTTGSMSGLIAAAKKKIWSIANQIILGEPRPVVRMALVPFRDKGDAYVTKVFDLTDNIDEIYGRLMKFQATGGGDTPENVNQALFDAINKLSWSKDKTSLKIIYLVGDSPPHNEYKDVPTYDKLAKQAIEKGIYINTIRCGSNSRTAEIWKKIALLAEGSFIQVDAAGRVAEIATPHDKKLAELNAALLKTAVVYGNRRLRGKQSSLNMAAGKYRPTIAADRAAFVAKDESVASNDLLEEVEKKRVDLAKVKKDLLPGNMQKMTPEQRKKYVADRQAKRDVLMKQIKTLAAKRTDYIKKQLAKATGTRDNFDERIVETLKRQAAKKNISYK